MSKNLNRGFLPLIIIAIVAVVAIGGGVYYTQNNSRTETELDSEANVDFEGDSSMEGDIKMSMKDKGSLKALLSIGKDTTCTFTSSKGGYESKGTVFVTSGGNMRGDFVSTGAKGAVDSHIIITGDTSYSWTGSQGAKMSTKNMTDSSASKSDTQSSVDLDQDIDYECKTWKKDESKFSVPSDVKFIDIDVMMQGMMNTDLPTGVDIEAMMKAKVQ